MLFYLLTRALMGDPFTASYAYAYNSANERTGVTNADNSRWAFQYDALGQVTSGRRYWSDGMAVAGQQFAYGFDDIGNRTNAASGGDETGANLRVAMYFANNLNQYTNRTVPGYINVLGAADPDASITTWGTNGLYGRASRHGDYFRTELSVSNSSSALWLVLTNLAVLTNGTNPDILTNTTGSMFVARTPESFGYDPDGNMTNEGRWLLTWDAENRLASVASLPGTPGPQLKLEYFYDYRGRRIEKVVSTNDGSGWVAASTNRFVYDGWKLIGVLGPQGSLLRSFVWGLDLSGALEGAGGVGGLLMVSDASQGTHFAACDGNGNVTTLVNAGNGAVSAQYEYGPFGELLRATGPMASENPFRFSTKYQDDESDLLYFHNRYFHPSTGRWLSRDPIAEVGGINQYAFVSNDPLDNFDPFGLCEGGSCGGGMMAISLPSIPGIPTHKSFCTWLEGKIRSYLHTAEEKQGWDNFVGGSQKDIELSDDQMRQVIGLAHGLQAEIQKQAKACQRTKWDVKKTDVGDFIGAPWALALGRVSIKLTTHCNCGTLTWVACIDDLYNFDPQWFLGGRSPGAELDTILVWAAQNASGCGWKEFRYKGCWNGFGSSGVQF